MTKANTPIATIAPITGPRSNNRSRPRKTLGLVAVRLGPFKLLGPFKVIGLIKVGRLST
jgi:antitoxin (DNA-binding transcriptional repressor) of toxin-antitoxin stability system